MFSIVILGLKLTSGYIFVYQNGIRWSKVDKTIQNTLPVGRGVWWGLRGGGHHGVGARYFWSHDLWWWSIPTILQETTILDRKRDLYVPLVCVDLIYIDPVHVDQAHVDLVLVDLSNVHLDYVDLVYVDLVHVNLGYLDIVCVDLVCNMML